MKLETSSYGVLIFNNNKFADTLCISGTAEATEFKFREKIDYNEKRNYR